MRKKGSPVEWERVRNIAANMIDAGMEPVEVAKLLKVSAQTVREWRRQYLKHGREALASRKPSGRPTELNSAQREELALLLKKTPKENGFERYLWTQQLIAELIQQKFGVSYHHDHVGVILKQMNFTHQKPSRRSRERDEQLIQTWRQETWPALLKKVQLPAGSS